MTPAERRDLNLRLARYASCGAARPDPVGPANDEVIECVVTDKRTGLVVVAWGQHGAYRNRGLIVLDRLRELGLAPMRLGSPTKGGHPWHPLYRKDDIELEAA